MNSNDDNDGDLIEDIETDFDDEDNLEFSEDDFDFN